jgi:putative ABC transport system permease protein
MKWPFPRIAGFYPEKLRLRHDTVAERKRDLGRSLDNLYHFLNLVGFIALLIGGVGIASAIHVHIKQKLGTVAILRCLGSSVAQTFAIYLAQGMTLGWFGAGLGGLLGLAIQSALPRVMADFIPFAFQFHTAWLAIGRAMAIGFGICLMFSLLPLLTVRKVSPLAAIRVAFEPQLARHDPLRWLAGAGRYQRLQESVLLRTLGATRGQILEILLVAYAALGFLAALTGILLAVAAAWVLMRWVFHAPFALEWASVLIPLVLVPGITVTVGFLMTHGILKQSPLSVLRTEV